MTLPERTLTSAGLVDRCRNMALCLPEQRSFFNECAEAISALETSAIAARDEIEGLRGERDEARATLQWVALALPVLREMCRVVDLDAARDKASEMIKGVAETLTRLGVEIPPRARAPAGHTGAAVQSPISAEKLAEHRRYVDLIGDKYGRTEHTLAYVKMPDFVALLDAATLLASPTERPEPTGAERLSNETLAGIEAALNGKTPTFSRRIPIPGSHPTRLSWPATIYTVAGKEHTALTLARLLLTEVIANRATGAEMGAAQMREACAAYHDELAGQCRAVADERQGDPNQDVYEDAKWAAAEHAEHAAAIRALPLAAPASADAQGTEEGRL